MRKITILQPHITEKSVNASALNKYVFIVDIKASKQEIEKAIEDLYKVKVNNVHTIRTFGKTTRVGRVYGKRSDWKKAIVTLEKGQKIKDFEVMEESEKEEPKAKAKAKKEQTEEKKEGKK